MGRDSDAKERILENARELIYARSYASVGVQEICNQAKVKKGSFYHFFPSKRDLTLAVLEECRKQSAEHAKISFARDIPPLQRFDRHIQFGYECQKRLKEASGHMPGCPFANLAGELSTQDEVIRQRLNEIFLELIAPFETALEDAVRQGDIPEVEITASAEAIFAYLEGIVLLAKTRNDPELILKLGQNISQVLIKKT